MSVARFKTDHDFVQWVPTIFSGYERLKREDWLKGSMLIVFTPTRRTDHFAGRGVHRLNDPRAVATDVTQEADENAVR